MKKILVAVTLSACMACTHRGTDPNTATTDKEPTAREGWEEMKEGGRETASGAGEVAEATGDSIKDSAKSAGHAIKATACPVVADKTSRTYYTKSDKQYDAMLKGEKVLSSDNRECFMNEKNAREGGYKSVVR